MESTARFCGASADKDKWVCLSIPANVISLSEASCSLWHIKSWKTGELPAEGKASRKGGVGGGTQLSSLLHNIMKTDQSRDWYCHLTSETHFVIFRGEIHSEILFTTYCRDPSSVVAEHAVWLPRGYVFRRPSTANEQASAKRWGRKQQWLIERGFINWGTDDLELHGLRTRPKVWHLLKVGDSYRALL